MLNRTYLVVALMAILGGLVSWIAPTVAAQTNQPGIKITIDGLKSTNGKVSGSLSLNNLSSLQYPQLFYDVSLNSPATTKTITVAGKSSSLLVKGLLISYVNNQINIDNLASTNIPFELAYNPKLQSGDFSVIANLKTSDGQLLGYATSNINLKNEDTGFNIDSSSCEVVVNKTRFNTADGPIVTPQDNAYLDCLVKNLSSQKVAVSVYPAVDYAVRNMIGTDPKQIKQSVNPATITFNPGQEKKVQFKIPVEQTPQVYDGFAYLLDNAKVKISGSVRFRWIVSGASSHIESINLDKDHYQANEIITATVLAYPSMDSFWRNRAANGQIESSPSSQNVGTDLKGAVLKVSVTDQSGSACGQTQINLPDTSPEQPKWPVQTAKITATRDCKYPIVTAEIVVNNQTLSSLSRQMPVLISPDVESKQKNLNYVVGFIIAAGAILGLIAGILFLRRKRKTPPSSPQTEETTQQPPTTPPVLPVIIALLISLGLFLTQTNVALAQESSNSAIIKTPINNPISSQNIVIKRGFIGNGANAPIEDNFYSNFTNFVQVDSSGSSSVIADAQCGGVKLKLVGYSSNEHVCGNKKSGIRYIITIDGQPAQISNVTSPDSNVTLSTSGSNSFDVWEFSGARTADLDVTLAGGIASGNHNIAVKVIGLGLVDSNHTNNFYEAVYTSVDNLSGVTWANTPDANLTNCNSKGECYGTLAYQWSCDNGNRCNQNCERDDQCAGATKDGCTVCLSNASGSKTCQTPPSCGSKCYNRADCASSTKDNCTECLPNDAGTGSVCSQPPACGVGCTRDDQCAGSKDGCTVCAKDSTGKGICQTPFSDDMCKCDGFNAINLQNPASTNFQFEAFAKVEGGDTKNAKVQNIQFQMTKSTKSNPNTGTTVATSGLITPEIVSSSASKVRYRAAWSVSPPAYDPNAIYRVFSNIKCARKTASSSASLLNNGQPLALYDSDSNKVLGTQLNYTPARLTQSQNLELGTLTDGVYTQLVDTDSCRFLRFQYGSY